MPFPLIWFPMVTRNSLEGLCTYLGTGRLSNWLWWSHGRLYQQRFSSSAVWVCFQLMSFHAFRPWLQLGEKGNICPSPHFTFLLPTFLPCPPDSVLVGKKPKISLKSFVKNGKREGIICCLEEEACGHGTHSGCFRVETSWSLWDQ